jgi:membrane protein implicated in regulation of membrane protease activity
MSWFSIWWVWIAAGFALAALEVVLPGYIFLGFAGGAVLTGVLVGIGLLGGSVAPLVLVFALASLASWLITRKLLGSQAGQAKIWEKDINDN